MKPHIIFISKASSDCTDWVSHFLIKIQIWIPKINYKKPVRTLSHCWIWIWNLRRTSKPQYHSVILVRHQCYHWAVICPSILLYCKKDNKKSTMLAVSKYCWLHLLHNYTSQFPLNSQVDSLMNLAIGCLYTWCLSRYVGWQITQSSWKVDTPRHDYVDTV